MMYQLLSFVQAVISGVLIGSLFALIAMGMALVFGVMRIVNFAHGTFLMLGMYATYVLYDRFGINPYIGFIFAAVILFLLGILIYQQLLRRIEQEVARDHAGFALVERQPHRVALLCRRVEQIRPGQQGAVAETGVLVPGPLARIVVERPR